jgi:hypothetical protein
MPGRVDGRVKPGHDDVTRRSTGTAAAIKK